MDSWRKRQLAELVFIPAFAFLPAIYSSFLLYTNTSVPRNGTDSYGTLIYSIIYQCLLLLILQTILRKRQESFRDLGVTITWSDILFGFVLFIITYWLSYAVQIFLIDVLPPSYWHYLQPKNLDFIPTYFSPLFLIYVLINPFNEELIVRGFIIRETYALTRDKSFAIIISVLFQVSYHLYQGLVPACILALTFTIFSIFYVKTSRLTPVIVAHLIMDVYAAFHFVHNGR